MATNPSPIRPARAKYKKVDALTHMSYEVCMTAEMAQALRMWPTGATQVEMNAAVESGLIHARTLTEFFLPKNSPGDDDMTPEDFAPLWKPTPTNAVQVLRMNRRTLHAQVAHLSWRRVEKPQVPEVIKILVAAVEVSLSWHGHLQLADPILAASPEFVRQMTRAQTAIYGAPATAVTTAVTSTNGPVVITRFRGIGNQRPR